MYSNNYYQSIIVLIKQQKYILLSYLFRFV